MIATERIPAFELTANTPYLALTGELWGVCYENFEEFDRVITAPDCTCSQKSGIHRYFSAAISVVAWISSTSELVIGGLSVVCSDSVLLSSEEGEFGSSL